MRKKSLEKCAEEHVRVEFGATISGVQERREGVGQQRGTGWLSEGYPEELGDWFGLGDAVGVGLPTQGRA